MGLGGADAALQHWPNARLTARRASFYIQAMLSLKSYFFGFFWFSHRTGGGEANA